MFPTSTIRRRRAVVPSAAILAAALLAAACSDDDGSASTSEEASATSEASQTAESESTETAAEATEPASETSETAAETTDAAPGTTEDATESTEPADAASGSAVVFDLPTDEMSDDDVAALPDIEQAVAIDPADLFEDETPGLLFGVWDPDRGVHLGAAGVSEVDTETAMTPDLSFRIGSITKTFTATAVLMLVDDGEVDLDEPVATYVGDLTAALPGGDTATVRQLLGMVSGFPEYTEKPTDPFGQALLEPDHEFTPEELIAAAAANEPTSTEEMTYVNTNYIVLGELIAEVSGQSYGEFVQERILDPVGLENTIIPDPNATAPTTTHGYLNASGLDFGDYEIPADLEAAAPSGLDVTEMSTSVGGTAGNGVSTMEDLATWAATDFGNALLSESSQQARLEVKPFAAIPGTDYGLGLQVIGDWHGHGGEILGWESQVFANPTTGQVAVVNANACCGLVGTNFYVLASAFPDDPDMQAILALVS